MSASESTFHFHWLDKILKLVKGKGFGRPKRGTINLWLMCKRSSVFRSSNIKPLVTIWRIIILYSTTVFIRSSFNQISGLSGPV